MGYGTQRQKALSGSTVVGDPMSLMLFQTGTATLTDERDDP